LVEDELLLALPLVPMHARCPVPLVPTSDASTSPDAAAEPARNPFAALAGYKRRPGPKG